MINESRAVELLGEAFRCAPVETEHSYEFTPRLRSPNLTVGIAKSALSSIVSDLHTKSCHASLWLNDATSMEILVRRESSTPIRSMRGDELQLRDDDNGVSYAISAASDAYILFFLDAISEHSDAGFFLRGYPSLILDRRLAERDEPPSVFELIRLAFLRITTVRITCDAPATAAKMASFANAFLFQVAFNTDIALVPQKELEAMSRSGRISRMRRNRPAEMDPPRRTYNEDLIHHYLMAISTDNPFVGYLSHYHVLEHFYEAVFQDDLISAIQHQVTAPAFSYRRKKDIKGLIRTVRKSLKIQNDTITFSEVQALQLTLLRFVSLPNLLEDLDNYDAAIVDYYRDNKVEFANAPEIDLRSNDKDALCKSIAKRIYATRNALVHSKDNDKAKYTPFVDDHVLAKELPLLRFVAERTILENSTIID